MGIDLNTYPYYSDDDRAYDTKNFKQNLFKPGKAVQARELTQSQSLINRQIKDNMDTIYRNGTIIDGIDLAVTTEDSVTTIYISKGRFYFEGRVLNIDAQERVITGTGNENFGLFVKEEKITVAADDTLKDPAQGYVNYGLEGADRLKITVELIKVIPEGETPADSTEKTEDTDGVTKIWELVAGVLVKYVKKPQYSVLSKVLAERTYHESGNYLVEGMSLNVQPAATPEAEDPDTYDNPNVNVTVSPGICYVRGYNATFIIPVVYETPKALTYKIKLNEPHVYDNAEDTYTLIEPYAVIDSSIEDIIVSAIVRVSSMGVTRGSGDYDEFYNGSTTYTSINEIESIAGYTKDVDYELDSDQIHWIPGENRPSGGSTYYVTFTYWKNCERGVDFTVSEDTEIDDVYNIIWTETGDLPVDGLQFLVDYYRYLARTDLFSIDKFGNIIRSIGIPTEYDEVHIPHSLDEVLPLGWIKFIPGKGSDDVEIYEYDYKRTTMNDLHYLKKRVSDLEENVAALALEGEVKEGELSTTLKGIYVDPFNSNYKSDITNINFYAALNLLDNELSMVSLRHEKTLDRSSDALVNITTFSNSDDFDEIYTLEKTGESAFFDNNLKSETINLNPYGIVKRKAFVNITPDKDHWIDYTIIEKTFVRNQTRRTITSTQWLKWSRPKRRAFLKTSKTDIGVQPPNTVQDTINERKSLVAEKIDREKVTISENLITFARPKTITATGKNFTPESYVAVTIDSYGGKLLAVSPYRNEEESSEATGRIIVASDGSWKGTFIIPRGVKSGNIELRFIDDSEDNCECIIIYKSKGIKKVIENRTTITRIYDKNIDIYKYKPPSPVKPVIQPPNPDPVPTPPALPALTPTPPPKHFKIHEFDRTPLVVDPVAQTFVFENDYILTAVELFFGTKADDNPKPVLEDEFYDFYGFKPTHPVLLQIGYVVNGYPDVNNIIHYQEIYPDEITTSLYGTAPTHITLTRPIHIPSMRQFFISFGSKSTEYTVFIAKLGDKDLDTQQIIPQNPYLDGVLFTSSNGIAWTALQDKDLTIKLYSGIFDTTGSITTEEITFPLAENGEENPAFDGFGRFMLMNDFWEVPNSGARFYYSVDSGTTWFIFNPNEEIDLESENTKIKFKIELEGDGLTTPFVELHNNLFFFMYDINSTNQYLTKSVENVPPYNSMKLILDEKIEQQTSIVREFSIDGGVNWLRFIEDSEEDVDIGGGFSRNHYIIKFGRVEKLEISGKTGGDFVIGNTITQSETGATGDVMGINSAQTEMWVIHDSDTYTQFGSGNTISNGLGVSANVDSVSRYTTEPEFPTLFKGRLLLESSAYWKSPILKNVRWIMRVVY